MDASLNIVSRLLEKGHHIDDLKMLLSPFRERGFDEFAEQMAIMLSKVSALLEISNELSETLSLDTLLHRIIQIATEALDADRGTLFLYDAPHKELFSRVLQGDSVQEIRFPCHLGIAGAVFTSGEPIIIHDAYSDPRFNKEIDRKTGYHTRNILCAPIKTRHGAAVGVIQLLNKAENRGTFNQDDLVLLRSITSQASAALQNAQLFEQVQKARAEQERLLELSTAISSELQLSSLLAKIMETTTIILNAERSTLFLHDARTNELWAPVAQGMDGGKEIRFPSHLGIAGSVFTSGNTVNIPDAYADPRFNKDFDRKTGYVTRNILCMPVINKSGKVIGVTQVLNKRGGPFARSDEQKLAAFSAQASIAIENARLFEDVMNMKNYNESILQSMSNALITLDGTDHIVTANAAAGRMLQCDTASLLSQTPTNLFGSANEWLLKLLGSVAQSKKPEHLLDSEIQLPNNKHVSVNASAVPLISIKQ
ncbi:MAG TPA: GAF domain-containing protein, partial [Candidatus Ozemobacteraceae bacterium]|nr:GAF domain-containing protein [Candidatus Ozemobacteraceae bacterium]